MNYTTGIAVGVSMNNHGHYDYTDKTMLSILIAFNIIYIVFYAVMFIRHFFLKYKSSIIEDVFFDNDYNHVGFMKTIFNFAFIFTNGIALIAYLVVTIHDLL